MQKTQKGMKLPKPKHQSKYTIPRLRRLADKAWFDSFFTDTSDYAPGDTLLVGCMACEKLASQVHHFFYKGSYSHLRYDIDNGVPLCKGCHFLLHHHDPKVIEAKIIARRGPKWLKRLEKKTNNPPKKVFKGKEYYKGIIEQFKN